jgi:two-component system chemotaxis response regulator CheY
VTLLAAGSCGRGVGKVGRSGTRAHNSAVECVLHTDEVAGSNPAAPTRVDRHVAGGVRCRAGEGLSSANPDCFVAAESRSSFEPLECPAQASRLRSGVRSCAGVEWGEPSAHGTAGNHRQALVPEGHAMESHKPDGGQNSGAIAVTARQRVLLADDDEDVRSVFEIVLAETFDVRAAATAADTLAIAMDWQPDVLLLDWTLPDATGEEIVARLRARESGCATLPIVVVSGDATVKEIARRIGAIACPKPCAVEQLMTAIERALEKPRSP